jgi:hypothetical protein
MPNLFGSSSPGNPPPDLHSKLQAELPRYSKTDTINSIVRTFSASKALNQMLGMRDPEPFVAPPAIPNNLAERFEAGLQEYEQLYAAGVFTKRQSETFATSASSQQSKTTLTDILEEKESPVRASSTQKDTANASSKLTISVPKYTSRKHAVAAAQQYILADSASGSVDDTASHHTSLESDEDHGSRKHGASTTLAASNYSRPNSAASGPPSSFPVRTSSLLPLPDLRSSDATASQLLPSVTKKLPGSRAASNRHVPPENNQCFNKYVPSYTHDDQPSLKRSESLPVLFPSPGVALVAKEPAHNEIARRYAGTYVKANDTLDEYSQQSSQNVASSPPPRITIQAPSPVKSTKSRKRAPSTTQEDFGPSLTQRSRRDDTTGLPVLPLEAEDEWTDDFPGNTYSLLTIILTWSHTMWISYHRLHDPKLFSIHPAFAYPITPPVKKELVSISFYDTNVEPHKEVRFLGPGDAAEMTYHEVDVFADPNSKTGPPSSPRCNSPVDPIKQTFGVTDKEAFRHVRYTSMAHRAKTGEGRWCYILIKGNAPPDGTTPPHVILAWHISAVTSTSDCLHTIYTDDPEPSKAPASAPSQNKVKRFSSLQNLAQTLRSPRKFHFHHSLRTASSSSELEPVDPYATKKQQEGVTLHRVVVKLEKAGSIPLIEGYRVDVKAFRDWMDACGRGEGKVILWIERDGL